jgi:DNA-binding NarL/FixJ family response regulator
MIRVLIADDQDLIRGGLRAILEAEPDIRVVADVAEGRAALQAVVADDVDVALMDLQMPGMDGIEATTKLVKLKPTCRVLVLTMFDLDEYVFAALQAGASGFLLKTTPPQQLARAIRDCHAGEMLFAPSVTRRLIETFVRRPPRASAGTVPEPLRELTDRELAVLRAVARGMSNGEIAATLFLGEATVKSHISHILAKLGLRDRVQAVVFAYECGLVSPQEPGGGG